MKDKDKSIGQFITTIAATLPGKRFGKLLVLSRSSGPKSPMICRCDCGKEVIVRASTLTSGGQKSCGCSRMELTKKTRALRGTKNRSAGRPVSDLTGQRFGRLIVLRLASEDDWDKGYFGVTEKHGKACHWVLRCDCGKTLIRPTDRVKAGKSCGCRGGYTIENTSRSRMSMSRGAAAARGHLWHLSAEEFQGLVLSNCHYCGREPSRLYRGYRFNGVDRLDGEIGYVLENCVACCPQCNYAKHTMSVDEFKAWVKRVYQHLFQHDYEDIGCFEEAKR